MKKARRRKGNGRATKVSAEAFVRAWKRGGTIADVASRVGMNLATATARATRFRKAGVNLPKLERRSTKKIDIAALNALLRAAS